MAATFYTEAKKEVKLFEYSTFNWFVNEINLFCLILLHSERPKLYAILAFLSAIGLIQ